MKVFTLLLFCLCSRSSSTNQVRLDKDFGYHGTSGVDPENSSECGGNSSEWSWVAENTSRPFYPRNCSESNKTAATKAIELKIFIIFKLISINI